MESKMKNTLRLLVPLLAAALLAGCGSATPTPSADAVPATPAPSVIAEGHLAPARSETLGFQARGRIGEILVKEGDPVTQGQVLVRLGDREQAEAAVAAAQLELTAARQAAESLKRTAALAHARAWQTFLAAQKNRGEAQRAWERLDLDALDRDIEDAQATLEDRRADLKDAQQEFDKYKDLAKDNSSRTNAEDRLEQAGEDLNEAVRRLDAARARRDSVRAARDAAQAQEAEARRTFENSQDGPDKDQAALAEARLANAEAQHAAAQAALDRFDLKAPFDGVVVDLQGELQQTVGPETWVVLLADNSSWTIDTTDLTELEVVKISLGDAVTLKADALPDEVVNGTVTDIGSAPKLQGGDVLYTVRISPAETDPRWRWGMTFEVTFTPVEK
ncbi:MAG: HlyD family efflux transporter periplasmic adaptor subunit [Chloroflexi bacterium]|nr:HlyD family efflux transporter periplasmic adaptor subunit [Chloroflexota bacterium]